MLNLMRRIFSKPQPTAAPTPVSRKRSGVFSTDDIMYDRTTDRMMQVMDNNFKALPKSDTGGVTVAMDSIVNSKFQFNVNNTVPDALLLWYGAQSFIGYQACAIMAQQWLVAKACLMPAKDAVRNGYEITVNNGFEVEAEVLDALRKADVKYKINKNLIQLVQMGRVFGIRIAMFQVDSTDPDYYLKPFNIDGVMPGSYKGISQIDPYWITPQLGDQAAGNPASPDFYEPTWWRINGVQVHRTHLVIYRTEEVADIIKPTYIYGGISIPQKIYERVYAAERTANEAPMLALTKRTDVIKTDTAMALAQQGSFDKRANLWAFLRDNFGIKFIDTDEEFLQFDTSLTDLDAVIMSQYQLVAAASNVPAVKLLGTSPKGFNTTGEHEEANYHEELESIQTHDLTPFLERHHMLVIRSEICEEFNIAPFEVSVAWAPLDAMTAKEQAEINKLKAEAGATLINAGVIDAQDERKRIVADPESGYNGLIEEELPEQDFSDMIPSDNDEA